MLLTGTMEQSKNQAKNNASKPQGVFAQLGPKTAEDCVLLFSFAFCFFYVVLYLSNQHFFQKYDSLSGAGTHVFVFGQMAFCQLEAGTVFLHF